MIPPRIEIFKTERVFKSLKMSDPKEGTSSGTATAAEKKEARKGGLECHQLQVLDF